MNALARALAVAIVLVAPAALAEQAVSALSPQRPLALSLRPGDSVVVEGLVATQHDGVAWDAVSHLEGGAFVPGGLYRLDGVGLRVAQHDPSTHRTRLVATGDSAPTCALAGLPAPCLVPRLPELAHERLLTTEAFVATLRGTLAVSELRVPPPPPFWHRYAKAIGAVLALGVPAIVLALLGLARRRRSPLGQVFAAAAEARRVVADDPTMARVGAEIDELVCRAERLDRAHAGHVRRRARFDRAAVERRLAGLGPETEANAETRLWLRDELAEIDRLDADVAATAAGLEQIAASLRVITLSGRAARGQRPERLTHVRDELALRERARVEVES